MREILFKLRLFRILHIFMGAAWNYRNMEHKSNKMRQECDKDF